MLLLPNANSRDVMQLGVNVGRTWMRRDTMQMGGGGGRERDSCCVHQQKPKTILSITAISVERQRDKERDQSPAACIHKNINEHQYNWKDTNAQIHTHTKQSVNI